MIYRSEWEDPAKPVTGPARKAATTATIVHYEGGGRTSHVADGAQWCRNAQSYYLSRPPPDDFSLGYNYAVISGGPQDGTAYEIRGTDINNAANKGDDRDGFPYNSNDYTRSIIVLGIQGVPMTAAAMTAVAQLTVGDLVGHRDVARTSCPGDPYYSQIPLIGTTPPEEDDMPLIAIIYKPPPELPGNPPWLLAIDGSVRYAASADAEAVTDHVVLNSEQYPLMLKSANLD